MRASCASALTGNRVAHQRISGGSENMRAIARSWSGRFALLTRAIRAGSTPDSSCVLLLLRMARSALICSIS